MLVIGLLILLGLILSLASLALFLIAAAPAVWVWAALALCVIAAYLFLYVVCSARGLDEEAVKNIMRVGMEAQARMDMMMTYLVSEPLQGSHSQQPEETRDGGSPDSVGDDSAGKHPWGGTCHEIRF